MKRHLGRMLENKLRIENDSNFSFFYKREFQDILDVIQKKLFSRKQLFVDVLLTKQKRILEIAKANGKYSTSIDVISFPLFTKRELWSISLDEINLGQIIFSAELVRENARKFGHSFKREFCYLFTHSILHLLGFDHKEKEEEEKMNRLTEEIMQEVKVFRVRGEIL